MVAETADQQFVGSVGVYHYNEDEVQRNEISLLVSRLWRQMGIGRRLVEEVMARLPAGLLVEAWVASANAPSLAAFHRTALHGNGSS